MQPVLVLYYSRHGSTKRLADAIAQGVSSLDVPVIVRTVKSISDTRGDTETKDASSAVPEVTLQELEQCSALALGSPTRFGNMAAPVKHFLDSTSSQWLKGALIDKPACVFTSSSSMHGGQESTLLSMMVPLIHHGMVICGLPYSEPELHNTTMGGSPYGVTHVAHHSLNAPEQLSADEKALCIAQGKRLAMFAKKLTEHA
ncbi:Flavodoxin/nitric oxide synthase [Alteromonas macleodii str. 'Black Sea 11']|nr:Flavodoxin/nitric oxide synthase [Alteromonas macleodii str. 'Black Sea 11']NKW89231.1 NAD(P)H:quinone oxidoreductase [Alteromonadaceae bacterium A_SAG4]NKX18563.1 NAD(P)H:quinone oxidoreductase [Alteromonadaceae bacterium A_SAG5]NKX36162.1 NAD(P)H:quinone oxidoreductase [Alteromonadaceae bacterium A_SAG3]NKX70323.1 NAD(P)H:quinone oxidoreductase [Alteromonadaceae bacterium A_SAG7]